MKQSCLIVLVLLISGCGPGDLRVRQLSIVDRHGTERIRLSVDDEDAARIGFLREDGKEAMGMSVKDGSATIALAGGLHNGIIILTASSLGNTLSFIDSQLNPRFRMGTYPEGAELRLLSDTGDQTLGLRSMNDGSTGLILDHHKELRIGAVVDRQGLPQLGIYGQAERALWQRP